MISRLFNCIQAVVLIGKPDTALIRPFPRIVSPCIAYIVVVSSSHIFFKQEAFQSIARMRMPCKTADMWEGLQVPGGVIISDDEDGDVIARPSSRKVRRGLVISDDEDE